MSNAEDRQTAELQMRAANGAIAHLKSHERRHVGRLPAYNPIVEFDLSIVAQGLHSRNYVENRSSARKWAYRLLQIVAISFAIVIGVLAAFAFFDSVSG